MNKPIVGILLKRALNSGVYVSSILHLNYIDSSFYSEAMIG